MFTNTNKTNGRNGSTGTSLRARSQFKTLTLIAVVALARVASAGPEIQVSQLIVGQQPIEVAEGGFSDFPPTEINETTLLFYSIENTGDEDLILDGAGLPELVQVNEGISGFSVLAQPNGFPIPAGFSQTFRLRFQPTTAATRTARVFIFSNAANTVGPFDFTLRGAGFEDCNDNDLPDTEDIADGFDEDCNFNDVPDVCEDDSDGDGFIDGCDECPGQDDLLDTDGDTVPDCLDNCPDDANADQLDSDGNGLGDACEEEEIVDCNSNGVADEFDVADETSYDCNTNGTPDECETLTDTDGDTVADGCDLCPGDDDLLDTDGDEYPDCLDNCPEIANPDQLDSDSNGLGDACEIEEEEPVVCTDEYLPVCGMDATTYDNACYADEAGMAIAYEGECIPTGIDVECTDEYEPVCGMNGMTYGNACYADQADASIAHEGACEVVTPPGNEDGKTGENGENTGENGGVEAGRETGQEENNAAGGSAGMCGAGGLGMLPLLVLGLCGLKLGVAGRSRRSVTTVTR